MYVTLLQEQCISKGEKYVLADLILWKRHQKLEKKLLRSIMVSLEVV